MKKINSKIYLDKVQNGARVLFNTNNEYFRLIDGDKIINESKTEQSYFLMDLMESDIYELTLEECYDLLSIHSCKSASKYALDDSIYELINNAE